MGASKTQALPSKRDNNAGGEFGHTVPLPTGKMRRTQIFSRKRTGNVDGGFIKLSSSSMMD